MGLSDKEIDQLISLMQLKWEDLIELEGKCITRQANENFYHFKLPAKAGKGGSIIDKEVKDCLPFDRAGAKFYTREPPESHFLVREKQILRKKPIKFEKASLNELLNQGEVWECNHDPASEIVLVSQGKSEEIREYIKQKAKEYCNSCKKITASKDLTKYHREECVALYGNIRMKYKPFTPEYILVKREE